MKSAPKGDMTTAESHFTALLVFLEYLSTVEKKSIWRQYIQKLSQPLISALTSTVGEDSVPRERLRSSNKTYY